MVCVVLQDNAGLEGALSKDEAVECLKRVVEKGRGNGAFRLLRKLVQV